MTTDPRHLIYQCTITLKEIAPAIWRRLQAPATYTFWDLHAAFQDAMGWLDYHLHVFRLRRPPKKMVIEIGIPDDEGSDDQVLPGWDIPLRTYFTEPGQAALYLYGFGDGWAHEVVLEGLLLKAKGVKYPRCLAGARACPPEDCGSVPGYERVVDILRHPGHADEFIPLSFWYDAPLTSQDRDRRHEPWLVDGSPTSRPARWRSWIAPA